MKLNKEAELLEQIKALKKTVNDQAAEISSLKERLAKFESDVEPAEEE